MLHHPDEEREACRPLRTAPCYDRVKARGAQFGQVNGWERPNYFAPQGFDDHAARSFRRGGWWPYAVEEAKAIRENVGMIDATAFAKHVVKGPGATAFLDWFTTNRLPKLGRLSLTYALTDAGTDPHRIHDLAHGRGRVLPRLGRRLGRLRRRLPAQVRRGPDRRLRLRSRSRTSPPSSASSPSPARARASCWRGCCATPTPTAPSATSASRGSRAARIELLMCPVNALRVAYTGELGWELHHPIEMQNYLFDRLMEAGEPLGLKLVGARAQNWLRQEKSYRAFGTELGRDATPLEADLAALRRPLQGLPRQGGDAGRRASARSASRC